MLLNGNECTQYTIMIESATIRYESKRAYWKTKCYKTIHLVHVPACLHEYVCIR